MFMYKQKESKDIFDDYVTEEMSLNTFLKTLSIETNNCEIDAINSDVNNKRKQLSEYLKKMGLQGILENGLNKQKQTKIFPVYQLLFFRRIFLDVNECKDGLMKKILSKKNREVTESDIEEFLERLLSDFDVWNDKYCEKYNIEIQKYDNSEMFEKFCAAEGEKTKNEEDKALLKEMFGTIEEKDKKILTFLNVWMQERFLLDELDRIINNKRKLDRLENIMLNEVKSRIEEVFRLDTIINAKIDTLDRYESKFGIINMPKSLLDSAGKEGMIVDGLKIFLLEEFGDELKELLNQWEKYIADFPVELEKQRREFVNEKTNIPPNEKKALDEVRKKNQQ